MGVKDRIMSFFRRKRGPDYVMLGPNRADIAAGITVRGARELAGMPKLETVQAEVRPSVESLQILNDEFFSRRPEVLLRFYTGGHDLSLLQYTPNVCRFSADCMNSCENPRGILHLPNLKGLHWDIYALTDFDILNDLPDDITELSLGETSSKRPRVNVIERFSKMKTLQLAGQQRGIEVIQGLSRLEDLTLLSISTEGLDYIVGLNNLWSLEIKLGGIRNLSALRQMPNLKYLELWMVRGLSDLSPISALRGLQNVYLQSLKQVTALPPMNELPRLRRVSLVTMNSLRDISSLREVQSLRDFLYEPGVVLSPNAFDWIFEMPNLKHALIGFKSVSKNEAFQQNLLAYGIEGEFTKFYFDYES